MENLEEKQILKIQSITRDHILHFLPAKSLTRFRAVATEWNERIGTPLLAFNQSNEFKNLSGFFCQQVGRDPRFITLDHDAYGVPDPSLTFLPRKVCIISSCSGLLLCQQTDGNFYICNPANKLWKVLPPPMLRPGAVPAMILALEPCAHNIEGYYSIISAVTMLESRTVEFEIYYSKTHCWSISDTIIVLDDSMSMSFTGNMFYYRGIAYWETYQGTVLCFNLKNGIYDNIPFSSETSHPGDFGQVQGEPCYASIVPGDCGSGYAIKIYNLAQQGLGFVMNVKFEGEFAYEPVPRVMPGFDGKTVLIHMGFFIYSCCADDAETTVVTAAAFHSCDPHKYLQYVNSLVQII